ncbi:aminotransferase class I/II-fold pyridoxal phosphate-dependent enzyme [Actinomadura sp. KC345]|uniref:trans-sulfuration enzyme family protein n=1 Tax=Actinomadura sp. KC345 TaxID=2530371 RepID=UPI001050992D|nr:aminotransferase class I/II-fold pyridoxal phosphate-dependent enzyme [Actinomadura sp. KC345]TDC44580.1 aminotransferase class I/II-fold pyridoxal phosphate-dependent enzyme [Actinomadura sp. KC345]
MTEHHPQTRAVHPPVIAPVGSRPLGVPIYQGHLFSFEGADELAAAFQGPDEAFMYGRLGNPTVRSLERAVAELEGGAGALATGSGMGAVNAVLTGLLRSGDHVIAQTALYGGTYALFQDLAERWGVEVTYVPGDDPAELREALRPATRLVYLETVANPTTHVTDIPAFSAALSGTGVLTVVDNTFAPLLCKPIDHGADIVIHSTTKYLSGHGDVVGGIVVFADPALHQRVWSHAVELGSVADPFAAWLTVRGLATVPMRVARQSASALDIAGRLAAHPSVTRVHYPGLDDHPQHDVARRLLPDGAGGVLAFELAGGRDAGGVFSEAVELIGLGPSLGAVVSLALHPASTSHRQMDAASLAAAGIGEGTVRLSVGLEHPDDLWADLDQALGKAGQR